MRTRKIGICDYCEVEKGIVAKGLCNACYTRKQKTGSLEYKRTGRNTCSIDGCDNFVVTMGLCDMHRQRVVKHGSTDQTRPDDWGRREKHPLYGPWVGAKRSRKKQLSKEWMDDFWLFVSDVKEKPSKKHQLKPKDKDDIIGNDNYYWHLPLCKEDYDKSHKNFMREDRKNNPDKYRNKALIKSFGIDLDDYNKMLDKQGMVCAICNRGEVARKPRTKVIMNLAVDHCHETDKIRGLLCSRCNTALGGFKDDVSLLYNAVKYLENANKD